MNRIGFFVVSLLVVLMVLSSTLFIVDQRQFAVVYSLGQIKEVITEPGLKFKLPPPVQNVVFLDRRVQTLDSPETTPIATAEKSSLVVDWLVKWRLIDPTAFIRANGASDTRNFESRLIPVVQTAFNEEITRRTVQQMVALDREGVMRDVKLSIANEAKAFGIEIVDVRIKRVDFSGKITTAVYDRMRSERNRVANQERSNGKADAVRIQADADRQRSVILAEAYREAQAIKGEGDAKAAALYAEAYGKDPQFAHFYRSLESYKATFRSKSDMVVVDPESEFFRAMKGSGSSGGKK